MQSLRRTVVSTARKGRTTLPRQPRRYAHDEHHHAQPVNESFGKGFWIPIALIPLGYGLYQVSRYADNEKPLLTRVIDKYTELQEQRALRNDLHVQMIEQAGADRVLFNNTRPQEFIDLRFPEIMSAGSPYNVPAGSQANISHVIAKYRKEQI
ncbi:NADH:ubiquinone oxidoreductase 17.8kD subunit, partial [Lojkania enalia]